MIMLPGQSRRTVLKTALALGAGPALAGCSLFEPVTQFDAIVSRSGDAASGVPRYPTVSAAVDAAPSGGAKPFRILVGKGRWRERVVIDKPFVHLTGMGRDGSVIVNDRYAGTPGADGKPVGTFDTATITVRAPDFSARDLTIANDFDYLAHIPPPVAEDKTGRSGSQAVALAIEAAADRSFLEHVRLTGYQDTLFTDAGRSLFRFCLIEGCVDFIFGAGRAVFERCDIRSRLRPGQDIQGFVAAPDTDVKQPYGLVFRACRLLKDEGVAPHSIALGRPWRRTHTFADGRYGDPDNVGAAAYLRCWMDDHIIPEGWVGMGYNAKGGGRAMLMPEEARLYEFESSGPGAGPASSKRRQLTTDQAYAYADIDVLAGWTPAATD